MSHFIKGIESPQK